MTFDDFGFFENLSRKFKDESNVARVTGTLHEDLSTFMLVFLWILLGIDASDKNSRENRNTHFLSNNVFSPLKSCLLRDIVKKYGRAMQTTDGNITRCREDSICTPGN